MKVGAQMSWHYMQLRDIYRSCFVKHFVLNHFMNHWGWWGSAVHQHSFFLVVGKHLNHHCAYLNDPESIWFKWVAEYGYLQTWLSTIRAPSVVDIYTEYNNQNSTLTTCYDNLGFSKIPHQSMPLLTMCLAMSQSLFFSPDPNSRPRNTVWPLTGVKSPPVAISWPPSSLSSLLHPLFFFILTLSSLSSDIQLLARSSITILFTELIFKLMRTI